MDYPGLCKHLSSSGTLSAVPRQRTAPTGGTPPDNTATNARHKQITFYTLPTQPGQTNTTRERGKSPPKNQKPYHGYQTCALIKNNSSFKKTPVIMLSSKDGLFDKAKGRIVGSDQYLTKPFSKDELLNTIRQYVPQAEQ